MAKKYEQLRNRISVETRKQAAERAADMLREIESGMHSVTACGLTRKELHAAVAKLDEEASDVPLS